MKADPYGFHMEVRPNTATVYYEFNNFKWSDKNGLISVTVPIFTIVLSIFMNYI